MSTKLANRPNTNTAPEHERVDLSPHEVAESDQLLAQLNDSDFSSPQDHSEPTNNLTRSNIGSQLSAAEQAAGNSSPDSSDVSNAEHQYAPSNPMNYDRGDNGGNGKKSGLSEFAGGFKGAFKKRTIGWIIGGSLGGLGIGAGFIGGPSLLLNHITAAMSGGIMNVQQAIMTNHTTHIYRGSLSGQVCQAVSATCKFKTMSQRQIKKFDKAGFKLYDASGHQVSPGTGRQSVQTIELPNDVKPLSGVRTLTADKLQMDDPIVRKALKKASYNPKFAGFSDRIFSRVLYKARASKRPPLPEAGSEEEMRKAMKNATNSGVSATSNTYRVAPVDPDDPDGPRQIVDQSGKPVLGDDGKPITAGANDIGDLQTRADNLNRATSTIANDAGDVASSGKRAVRAAATGMTESGLQKVAGFLSVTGNVGNYFCGIYNAIRAVGVGIKMIRNKQLIEFAMTFMSTADAIRAGDATPEQVEFLGNTLTAVLKANADAIVKDSDTGEILANIKKGDIVQGSATDGVGMKYVLFGDRLPLSESMIDFQGSLSGSIWGAMMTGLTSGFKNVGFGNLAQTCKTVRGVAFQIADLAAGVAITVVAAVVGVFTAGTGTIAIEGGKLVLEEGVKTAVKAAVKEQLKKMVSKSMIKSPRFWGSVAGNMGFEVLMAMLPGILTDLAAGLVIDDDTFGELAGDAWAVGASSMFKEACQAGGCSVLSPVAAAIYAAFTRQTASAYAEEERIGAHWYDITNPYTPLGSFAGNMSVRMAGATNSPSTFFAKTLGLVGAAFRGALASPKVSAEEISPSYFQCEDPDYKEAGVGCDYLGIPTYGLTEVTELDPTVEYMENNNYIDAEGETIAGTEFSKFIEKCVDRTIPIGTEPLEGQEDVGDGKECRQGVKPEYTYFYNYLVYKRILDSMDNEPNSYDPSQDLLSDDAQGSSSSLSAATPDDVTMSGRGWILTPGKDYSAIPCEPGTSTVEESYTNSHYRGQGVTFRTCRIDGTGIIVNSLISGNVARLIADAKAAGVSLGGYGWRSYETQKSLRTSNGCPDVFTSPSSSCRIPTAIPGYSNHEGGNAIDFTYGGTTIKSRSGAAWNWLAANAANYGLYNLPSEPWHWSTSGG